MRAALAALLLGIGSASAADPLGGLVLDDVAGRRWSLDELGDVPVLFIVADRRSAEQADAWGARLAAASTALAPWRVPGKVAWLSIADLRRVPDYARDSTRERLRAEDAQGRHDDNRPASPLLLDWEGRVAAAYGVPRGSVAVVLVAADRTPLDRAEGVPTDTVVARLLAAIDGAAASPGRNVPKTRSQSESVAP